MTDADTRRYPFTFGDIRGWTREPLSFTVRFIGTFQGQYTQDPDTGEITSFQFESPFEQPFVWVTGKYRFDQPEARDRR